MGESTEEDRKIIWAVSLWILVPIVLSNMFLAHSGVEGDIDIRTVTANTTVQASISKNPLLVQSTLSSSTPNLLKSDQSWNRLLDHMGRFLPTIKVEANVFRYNLLVKNNVLVDSKYLLVPSSIKKQPETYQSILSCEGKILPFNQLVSIKRSLYLGNPTDDDREIMGQYISDCLLNLGFSIKNDSKESFYFKENIDASKVATGAVTFLIEPDFLSKIFTFVGTFIAWSGLLILVREGFLKTFKTNLN